MKFEVINHRFTETVAGWMAKGYTINTATMNGSQGEVAKVDLTDGKEVIRVLLDSFTRHPAGDEHFCYSIEGVKLIVGRVTDTVVPNGEDTWNHIWNNRLEVLTCEEFCQIGRQHRNGSKWFGTEADAIAQQDKHYERRHETWGPNIQTLNDAAKEIVLPYVRRQPKCKKVKVSEIEAVTKRTDDRTGKNTYYVKFRGKELRLK